jgi:hypothetical protein
MLPLGRGLRRLPQISQMTQMGEGGSLRREVGSQKKDEPRRRGGTEGGEGRKRGGLAFWLPASGFSLLADCQPLTANR